jgi:hypothetical protein
MNLPNALTVGRIVATPLIATLPLANSWGLRLTAFILFLAAAISDYIDGYLARSRKQETDLGRLLDPLADKLLLVATFIPMYLLAQHLPFVTPLGMVGLPLWVVLVVLGRELLMTQPPGRGAARRGDRRDRLGEMEDGDPTGGRAAPTWFFSRRSRKRNRGTASSRARSRCSTAPSDFVDDRRRRAHDLFARRTYAASEGPSTAAQNDAGARHRGGDRHDGTSCSASWSTRTRPTWRDRSPPGMLSCVGPLRRRGRGDSARRRRGARAQRRRHHDGRPGPTSDDLTSSRSPSWPRNELDEEHFAGWRSDGVRDSTARPRGEQAAGDDAGGATSSRIATGRRPACGSRMSTAGGSRCSLAFRERCAVCSPTH